MDNTNNSLQYTDADGARREVKGCKLTVDKVGRYQLWSDQLEHNLAYKAKTKEDALLLAIDLLLFMIQLKDVQLKTLGRINDLALQFANEIKPCTEDDRYY